MMEGASFIVHAVDTPLVWRAAARSIADQLSFRDALIVEAAVDSGCQRLYSEDLQNGRVYGTVTVRNPFA